MKVLALGGTGLFGRNAVRHLVSSEPATQVTIASRNLEAGKRVASELGDRVGATQIDVREEDRLASLAQDYDLVLNTAGPEWEVLLPALRAAISAGTHYCDLGGVGAVAEEQLALHDAARAANVTAVVGAGSDPAVTSLLAVHAALTEFLSGSRLWPFPLEGLPGSTATSKS